MLGGEAFPTPQSKDDLDVNAASPGYIETEDDPRQREPQPGISFRDASVVLAGNVLPGIQLKSTTGLGSWRAEPNIGGSLGASAGATVPEPNAPAATDACALMLIKTNSIKAYLMLSASSQ